MNDSKERQIQGAKKGGAAFLAKYGVEELRERGTRGGQTTAAKGHEAYSQAYTAAHKARRQNGLRHHLDKLTANQVHEIRARAARRETYKALAKDFGVAITTIGAIVRRVTWKYVA